jgi:ketosteroid isomerase-like protein
VSIDLVARARAYLAAVERGATGDALAAFYAPDAIQEELPNRLVPSGAKRDLAALLDGAVRGQKVVRDQRYDVRTVTSAGDRVVLEVGWSAELLVPIGARQPGERLTAHFALFMDFVGDRIHRQRNYDCFDPF